MLSKRPRPVIGRLSELLVSGNRSGFAESVGTSPRSLLDSKIQSPRSLKNYDVGGVGLGIVAALDKSGHEHDQVLGKYAICCPNSIRSAPMPVNSGMNCQRWTKGGVELEMEVDSLENYTYVTCHGPNNQSYTKVYYDECKRAKSSNVVTNMPKQFQTTSFNENVSEYPTSDFLSCCNLCSKKLHGRDIYMYRGEKAFCSAECRSRQMMMEERKEQCRSQASTSADVSSSSYTRNPVFSTGIFAI